MDTKTLRVAGGKSDTIKALAIILMVIDHIGAVFFPYVMVYRIIGRLAFPLFAYQLAVGFRLTSNVNNYLKRLWIFALISQIPYTLIFDTTTLNIFFTLLLSLFLLEKIKEKEYSWIFTILMLSELVPMDYGSYGVLMVLIFSIFEKKRIIMFLSFIGLNLLFTNFNIMLDIQAYSILALTIICIEKYLPKITIPKKVSYWFYPLHLALFFVISMMII